MKNHIENFIKNPYVPLYSATLVLSAFLLFSIQPMLGKMLLPILGGSPSVWNTAMVFFQVTLLAGYAYAHLSAKFLDYRNQIILHIAVLSVFLFVLPVSLPEVMLNPQTTNPALWQLGIMAIIAGGPFFALAGTAPLLQKWFTRTPHPDADNPYFLYAASNAGSMTALLLYPFIIQPSMGLVSQSLNWASGYLLLITMMIVCSGTIWDRVKTKNASAEEEEEEKEKDPLKWSRRLLWLTLAFVPSSLYLGVTTYITTDLASVPFFWVIPLALYTGSFIVAFARRQFLSYLFSLWIQGFFFAAVILWMFFRPPGMGIVILMHLGLFAITATACHIHLFSLRPSADRLTEFYLIMATGGALGGIFNALIAPQIFLAPIEYPLVLALAAFLRFAGKPEYSLKKTLRESLNVINDFNIKGPLAGVAATTLITAAFLLPFFTEASSAITTVTTLASACAILAFVYRRWSFAVIVALSLLFANLHHWTGDAQTLVWKRNYFGIIRVMENEKSRYLVQGNTVQGGQPLAEENRLTPIFYYNEKTAAGEIFRVLDRYPSANSRMAVIGLGAGAVNCYGTSERHYDYFEIDPAIAKIAENPEYFTYLRDCGPGYDIITGDGRLNLAKKEDNTYHMLLLDAFSSDSIPVHLLTTEAFQVYRSKISSYGLIAVNLSNRNMDLRPVVAANADHTGMTALFKRTGSGKILNTGLQYNPALFAVVTNNPDYILDFKQLGWREIEVASGAYYWSDDYANIIAVLGRKK
jgi:hypothetical protein